jgi:hypothetical protein
MVERGCAADALERMMLMRCSTVDPQSRSEKRSMPSSATTNSSPRLTSKPFYQEKHQRTRHGGECRIHVLKYQHAMRQTGNRDKTLGERAGNGVAGTGGSRGLVYIFS